MILEQAGLEFEAGRRRRDDDELSQLDDGSRRRTTSGRRRQGVFGGGGGGRWGRCSGWGWVRWWGGGEGAGGKSGGCGEVPPPGSPEAIQECNVSLRASCSTVGVGYKTNTSGTALSGPNNIVICERYS